MVYHYETDDNWVPMPRFATLSIFAIPKRLLSGVVAANHALTQAIRRFQIGIGDVPKEIYQFSAELIIWL
jgi:hypothetical protein